tara:strand:+ start:102 stop:1031 length:930 start_codon:yes stop_codon:yes gene_type:complete
MAQANGTVANGSGAAVRTDINNQLAAVFSTSAGDTAPTTTFPCQLWADTANNQLKIRGKDGDTSFTTLRGLDGSLNFADGAVGTPSLNFLSDTNTGIYRPENDTIGFATGATKRMIIGGALDTNNGGPSLLWKTTNNPVSNNSDGIQFTDSGRVNIGNFGECLALNRRLNNDGTANLGNIVGFHYATTAVGFISVTASSTAYVTSSDYRLKQNVVALTGAKARLNQLLAKRFNFISVPGTTVDGFLAHEAATVVPECVTGTKDEVDSSGDPVYQGIDQAKLVPLLTAALQEAFAEIAALTTRVETLEAG